MAEWIAEISVWPVTSYYLISGAIKGGPGNPTVIQGFLPPLLGFGISYYLFGSPLEEGLPLTQHIAGYLATGAAQMAIAKLLLRGSQ